MSLHIKIIYPSSHYILFIFIAEVISETKDGVLLQDETELDISIGSQQIENP